MCKSKKFHLHMCKPKIHLHMCKPKKIHLHMCKPKKSTYTCVKMCKNVFCIFCFLQNMICLCCHIRIFSQASVKIKTGAVASWSFQGPERFLLRIHPVVQTRRGQDINKKTQNHKTFPDRLLIEPPSDKNIKNKKIWF